MVAGKGGLLTSDRRRADLRLVSMAVRKRWPVGEEAKRELVERLASIADQGATDEALRAIEILIAMESQNQKDDHRRGAARAEVARLDAIAKELGIEID